MKRVSLVLLCLMSFRYADAAQPAPNCNDPQSNLEMKLCAARDLKSAEAELKTAFERALASAEGQYRSVEKEPGFERIPNMPEQLRRAQRAWEAYRDLNCDYRNLLYYGGSMAPLAVTGCLLDMTKARTKELNEFVDPA
mgnify:CR=1 FL=1